MTPLELQSSAAAESEVWLSLREALAHGVPKQSFYNLISRGAAVREVDGEKQVALSSIPARYRRERAQIYQTGGLLPSSVDVSLAVQEAGRRYLLLERWGQLSRRDRLGPVGTRLRVEYAQAPAELVQQCHSLGDVPHPATLDGVLKRSEKMFTAGQNGALETLGRLGPRNSEREQILPEDAKAYVHKLWLKDGLRTKRRVMRTYEEEAKRRAWPAVSYSTISRIIDAIPPPVAFLAARGKYEFGGKASPHIIRDEESLQPGDLLVGDHHEFDFFVRDEITGELFRPWLTAWLDERSWAFQGWKVCSTPSGVSIKEAFAHAVKPKHRPEYELMCGLPGGIYIDNGKDYRSHDLEGRAQRADSQISETDVGQLRGLFPGLNISVTHAKVKNAKAKRIERAFGTIAADFSPMIPGYCGHTAQARPFKLEEMIRQHKAWLKGERGSTPFITLREVEGHLEAWMFEYHTREQKGLSAGGRSVCPVDIYRMCGRQPQLISDTVVELLLMRRHISTVQKNGVSIDGVWYWSEKLGDHYRPTGTKERVEVRRDSVDAGRVYVFSLEGQLICEAINVPVLRTGANPDELKQEITRVKNYERRQRKAVRTLIEAAPADAMSALEALHSKVPAPSETPFEPKESIHRMVPDLEGVKLRQMETPPEIPSQLLILDEQPEGSPESESVPLFTWEWEREEYEQQLAKRGAGAK